MSKYQGVEIKIINPIVKEQTGEEVTLKDREGNEVPNITMSFQAYCNSVIHPSWHLKHKLVKYIGVDKRDIKRIEDDVKARAMARLTPEQRMKKMQEDHAKQLAAMEKKIESLSKK